MRIKTPKNCLTFSSWYFNKLLGIYIINLHWIASQVVDIFLSIEINIFFCYTGSFHQEPRKPVKNCPPVGYLRRLWELTHPLLLDSPPEQYHTWWSICLVDSFTLWRKARHGCGSRLLHLDLIGQVITSERRHQVAVKNDVENSRT